MRQHFLTAILATMLVPACSRDEVEIVVHASLQPRVLPEATFTAWTLDGARTLGWARHPAWTQTLTTSAVHERGVVLAGVADPNAECRASVDGDVSVFDVCALNGNRIDDECSLVASASQEGGGLLQGVFASSGGPWFAIRWEGEGDVAVSLLCLPVASQLEASMFKREDVVAAADVLGPLLADGFLQWEGRGTMLVPAGAQRDGDTWLALGDYPLAAPPPPGERLYGEQAHRVEVDSEEVSVEVQALGAEAQQLGESEPNDVHYDWLSARLDGDLGGSQSLDLAELPTALRLRGTIDFNSDVGADYEHDVDVFELTIGAPASGVVWLDVDDIDADVSLVLFDDAGLELQGFPRSAGQPAAVYFDPTPLDAGTYYLAVAGFQAGPNDSTTYDLRLDLVPAPPS